MAKTSKILGATLLTASVVCFLAGSLNLNSALGDKAYWENKGSKSEADLNTLEDGLNHLKSNEKAYWDGRKAYADGQLAYEQGKKDLASGQKDYDEGYATLLEKQAEYDAGVLQLAAAEAELAAGKKTLDENYQAYVDGKAQIAQYEQGQAEYEQGLRDYNDGQAMVASGTADLIAGTSAKTGVNFNNLDEAKQYIEASEAKLGKVQPIVENIRAIQANYDNWLAKYNKVNAYQTSTRSGQPLSVNNIEEYQQVVSNLPNSAELQNILNTLSSEKTSIGSSAMSSILSGIAFRSDIEAALNNAGYDGRTITTNVAMLSLNLPREDFSKFISDMEQVGIVSNATVQLYETGMADAQTFHAAENQIAAGKVQLAASEPVLAAAKQTLDANYAAYVDGKAKIAEYEQGLAEYNAGLAEYNAGKAKLADGAAQLAAGREELEAGRQTIEDGKVQLATAETRLVDGKEQLNQFETGRDQAIAGINTVVATETYGDLTSIADRLGSDFKYVDNEGNLNIPQGMAVVSTARGFLADNTEAVTGDLTGRTVTSIVTLVAGALALVGGVVILRRS